MNNGLRSALESVLALADEVEILIDRLEVMQGLIDSTSDSLEELASELDISEEEEDEDLT
jgi:hypothetical protein